MEPFEIVKALDSKRLGERLPDETIRRIVDGFMKEEVSDIQMSAFLMAVGCRGLSAAETHAMTEAMVMSGKRLGPWPEAVCDKHSSGGVGDATTLIVGPIVAACGHRFAKLSGRSLAFAGGTIDRLEVIPGLRHALSVQEMRRAIEEIGIVIASQTADLVPADGLMYSLRDRIGAVASTPLIAASIMSKKLAAGADWLVLDVKCGLGAFCSTEESALQLADLMVDIGLKAGITTTALVTDMNVPLATSVGAALEVQEAIAVLRGERTGTLRELSVELAASVMTREGVRDSERSARLLANQAIDSGNALEKLRALVKHQGGDLRSIDEPKRLDRCPYKVEVIGPDDPCYIASIDAKAVGWAASVLGADGSNAREGAGVRLLLRPGQRVEAHQPAALVQSARPVPESVLSMVRSAFRWTQQPSAPTPLVLAKIDRRNRAHATNPQA